MALPYEVRVNITRERAHDLIIRLADEPDFREQFEINPYAMLSEHGIDVSPGRCQSRSGCRIRTRFESSFM